MSSRCSLGEGVSGYGSGGRGSPEVQNRNWQAENNLHVSPGRGRPTTWRSRCVQRGRGNYIKYYYWYYRFTFFPLPPPPAPYRYYHFDYYITCVRFVSDPLGPERRRWFSGKYKYLTKREWKKKNVLFNGPYSLSQRFSTGVARFYLKKKTKYLHLLFKYFRNHSNITCILPYATI